MLNRVSFIIIAVFLGLVILFVRNGVPRKNPIMEPQTIKEITVVSGHQFQVVLTTGTKISCRLKASSTVEAKKRVIEFLNNTSNPKLVVYSPDADSWVVDILVDDHGASVSLTSWLRQNQLALQ